MSESNFVSDKIKMAQSRSTPTKSKSTQNKKTTPSKNTKKSSGTPKKNILRSAAPKKERSEESKYFFSQIIPYIIVVFAIVLAVCFFFDGAVGIVGNMIKTLFAGLVSGASYTLPLFMVYHAIMYRSDREKNLLIQKIVCSSVTLVLIAVLMHLFAKGEDTFNLKTLYGDGLIYKGGGAIGGLFGVLLKMCFGIVGTLVIVVAVLIVFVLLMFNKTPRDLVILIAYKIKIAYETNVENRRNLREVKKAEQLKSAKKAGTEGASFSSDNKNSQVYRIKSIKRGKFDPDVNREYAVGYDEKKNTKKSGAESDGVRNFMNNESKSIIEDKIFDEVMRRSRERMDESGTAYDGTSVVDESIFTDNQNKTNAETVLTPVKKSGKTADSEINDIFSDELDLRKIFVNPDDVSLIDKIAEADITQTPSFIFGDDDDDIEITVEKRKLDLPMEKRNVSPVAQPIRQLPPEPVKEYEFPHMSFLKKDDSRRDENIREELEETAVKLVQTLKSFRVNTRISDFSRGPTITRYELTPEAGTRVRSISNLVDDISLNLASPGIRIEAPIPGKSAVGVEVPNKTLETVYIRKLLEAPAFRDSQSRLTAALGEDVAGAPIYLDIAKMPHLLIAGATGMGKSVCLNSIIVSLLYKSTPDQVKLILIDPKKVELNIYNGIPHLLVPVVSDPKKAAGSLHWAVTEMERRFEIIESVGVRDIKNYNAVTANDPEKEFMPQVVIIIDELADLMMTAPDDVEESICRLAQKARAAGMHLIIGTQRPSVDVITGLIKSNIPSRIAFTVASQIDSRTIIDMAGAEKLIGRGDMLYNPVGASKPIRIQGSYVSEQEVEAITDFLKADGKSVVYSDEVIQQIEKEAQRCGQIGKKGFSQSSDSADDDNEADPMLKSAIELAIESGKISTSLIQRRLSLGYGRAAKLIDKMEQLGYVSAPEGQKPRNVLLTKQQYMEMVLRDEDSITDGL